MATADFTIADVLEWARTKPANKEYNFVRAGVCALGQFARELGGVSEADARCELYKRLFAQETFTALRNAANGVGWNGGCTFGGFVARLEKLCPDTPVPPPSEWTRLDAYLNDIELAREGQSA